MHVAFSAKKQEARITALEAEVENLKRELGENEDADSIVKRHIKLLHQYNESKDAAQILIGKLALLKEVTITQIHVDLDLPTGD
ncbi:DNA repair protein [Desarmillaria tabescens]|uniref:DNA repair protein n=1 Tax=Armillaria tabescens TaxID=1929756 RepID=A0AA39NIG2_ARMTA|nr:DNA repair protein [Desarmillaria tabescens]KAK0466240.1 DNA repair protein [Desarmillaria tabescens]